MADTCTHADALVLLEKVHEIFFATALAVIPPERHAVLCEALERELLACGAITLAQDVARYRQRGENQEHSPMEEEA